MSISIQTNVSSLVAQQNLRVNSDFQSRTIQRLTSGYRINSSGDDAAGLAVANKFRSDISELTQGVRNANDGISGLQIIDGGLNNISNVLDRLKTLATQASSNTFNGDRSILNNEYQTLLGEIDRQAGNIGLVSGGFYNKNLSVYIGGGSSQTNSKVSVDLSGASNQADSAGLGIGTSSIAGGATELTNNTVRLDNSAVSFLASSATQAFTFHTFEGGAAKDVTVTVTGTTAGLSGTEVVDQLNEALGQYNIAASISANGELQFGGPTAFTVSVAAASGGNAVATTSSTASNTGNYSAANMNFAAFAGDREMDVVFQNASGSVSVTLDATSAADQATALATLNSALSSMGINVVKDTAGTGLSIQSSNEFSMVVTSYTAGSSSPAGSLFTSDAAGAKTVTAADESASSTGNALAALDSITEAVSNLGLIQGRVGTGQNDLMYAVQLAQSQIASFSAAESRIRDADVAVEAANLTKAQVLQQASLAAMAQANSAPQAVLSLLRG